MDNIIGIRFQPRGDLFYCDADDISLQVGDRIVVETKHGLDLAKIVIARVKVQANNPDKPLMKVIRHAQPEDLQHAQQDKEKEALATCKEMVAKFGLNMKPLSVHYNLDYTHLTMLFSAPERVDFRNLVRKLSSSLKTHAELRQLGPRDEAKLVGGIGKCGYPLCCQNWLTEFTPISIKMAKLQNLTLNPAKISGICGRLLCCLAYENKQYSAIRAQLPRVGHKISTPFGKAKVLSLNPLKETATVEIDGAVRELSLDQLGEKSERN